MQAARSVTVRVMAFLDAFCKERGLPTTLEVVVPAEGITALDLADSIGLPLDRIEGVFHNFSAAGPGAVVKPGDRVAFVPPGTPASHPAFFGRFSQTREERLTDRQSQLLRELVAATAVSRERVMMLRTAYGVWLQHPGLAGGRRQIEFEDAAALRDAGLIVASMVGGNYGGFHFYVAPAAARR
jgi:hypothetical protein